MDEVFFMYKSLINYKMGVIIMVPNGKFSNPDHLSIHR
jgi:hypothetical protein